MLNHNISLLITVLCIAPSLAADFTRYKACEKEGYRCGQCEPVAELPTEKLLEGFSGKTATGALSHLIGQVEKKLGSKMVPLYLGQSPSLMSATLTQPKIILKSPESEYLIAFNTDPKSEAFESIEIMRFDGKKAKFVMEQITTSSQGVQVHQNPASCVRCHGQEPRPLWDTYRAWPGMFAGRDDLVEKNSALTRPLIELLQKHGQNQRLALTLPTATANQIDAGLKKKDWFRIPHSPPVKNLKNISLRTADFAGPGHVLSDQLSANLSCVLGRVLDEALAPNEKATLKKK